MTRGRVAPPGVRKGGEAQEVSVMEVMEVMEVMDGGS